MVTQSNRPTAPPSYFYIIQSEAGQMIVEYASNAAPPVRGKILDLENITRNHGYVEVMKVEQVGEHNYTVVRVTVKPAPWRPEF
jgi:hypothetical protein